MAGPGHNSGFARDQLKAFVERIERMEEEQAALAADKKEIYAEAKGTGFDVKIMREIVRMRRMDKADLQQRDAMLDLYRNALDMNSDLI